MKEIRAVSYIEEKYRTEILEVLSTYNDLKITKFDFVNESAIVDLDNFTFKKAYSTAKSLYGVGISMFILGVARPIDILTAEAILEIMEEVDDVMLIIVATTDDMLNAMNQGSDRLSYILENVDKVVFVA